MSKGKESHLLKWVQTNPQTVWEKTARQSLGSVAGSVRGSWVGAGVRASWELLGGLVRDVVAFEMG